MSTSPGLPDAPPLLSALQFADSFFPSGGTAFSWGLESMVADGLARGAPQVLALMQALISHRWAGFDRPLLRAAHQADGELATLMRLDALCEAMTLSHGARDASRRLGFTQLRVHAALGLPLAARCLEAVQAQRTPGHLPVVQGALWQALGLGAADAEAMSAFGLCTAVVGAALRLGLVGHLDGQRLLGRMRPLLAGVLASEPPALDALWTGALAAEIAGLRHEPRHARLFAN